MGCRGQRGPVVALLLTMNFVEAMNGTLLGLLIPVVAADFAVSTELAAWIQLGPAFTSAMFGPAIGMVADTIGRTGTWRVFAAVLMLSLPACGFAPDIVTLLVARTLGGMSWAASGFAIMVDGMEASRRGIIAAWQQTCGMTGGSVGTATGGLLITFMGWRSVFYLAMGPVTLLWLLSFCVLPQDKAMSRAELSNKLQSFDKVGTLLFVVFSGAALLVLNRGNDLGWDSNLVMTCAAIAAVSLPLLVLVERAADHPVLPFSLILADPIATKCLILGAGTWTSYQGNFLVLPIFLQMARGLTPAQAGLILFCRPVGGALVSASVSRYMTRKKNPALQWVLRAGSLSMTIAFLLLFFLAHRVEEREEIRWLVMLVLLLQAGGGTAVTLPSQAILVSRMPANRMASITSTMQMVTQVTAMLGMTVMLAMVRGWGIETDALAYRPVWLLCAGLSVVVHGVGWTIGANSQHVDVASVTSEVGTPTRPDGEVDRATIADASESERAGLLQAAQGGGEDEND